MLSIGIDIGTTKIAGVLIQLPENRIVKIISRNSDADINAPSPWAKLQDTDIIINRATDIICQLINLAEEPIGSIGISCQMHGFLYTDLKGNALSPLQTWLDSRASQAPVNPEGTTAVELILEKTGHSIYSGYALSTHYYNYLKGLCPEKPYKIVSIGGYLEMKLCGSHEPCIDPSEGAGFGLYDHNKQDFFHSDIYSLFGDDKFLPRCVSFYHSAGLYNNSIPVFQSLGDNQAGFIGTMKGREDSVLISIGTSGQISFLQDSPPETLKGIEVRPFPDNNLLVGSTLAGGKALELLVDFFKDVLLFFGSPVSKDEIYKIINNRQFEIPDTPLKVDPFFNGTRENPMIRGSINNINIDNLNAYNMIYGFAEAVVMELKDLYDSSGLNKIASLKTIIGSGNAIRKNPKIQQIIKDKFNCELILSDLHEEAACGAAIYASVGLNKISSFYLYDKQYLHSSDCS